MAPPIADLSAILKAAMEVFFRFGYKKASMDDIAQAAGLSRQGLYLKFSTKEQLFKAALEHLASHLLKEAEELSRCAALDVESRLMMIFDAIHGDAKAPAITAELLDHARSKHLDTVRRFEQDFIQIIEALLIETGVDKQWLSAHMTARNLSEHLLWAASGIKGSASTGSEYKGRMAISIALVVRGEAIAGPLFTRETKDIT
jgi:AcrR family transcriptional regulator